MKRAALSLAILTLIVSMSAAGEVSTFLNLGFSADSSAFAFGYYGVRADERPFAELFVVNVARNDFVRNGRKAVSGTEAVSLGQDGVSTMYRLMSLSGALFADNKIDHEKTGRLVYVLLNGEEPRENLAFKDFETGVEYSVQLSQKSSPEGASFSIKLVVTDAKGLARTWDIGLPGLVRKGVESYRIRQIILGPGEKSLVFVVEKKHKDPKDGISSTYMVETVVIQP